MIDNTGCLLFQQQGKDITWMESEHSIRFSTPRDGKCNMHGTSYLEYYYMVKKMSMTWHKSVIKNMA